MEEQARPDGPGRSWTYTAGWLWERRMLIPTAHRFPKFFGTIAYRMLKSSRYNLGSVANWSYSIHERSSPCRSCVQLQQEYEFPLNRLSARPRPHNILPKLYADAFLHS